MKKKILTLFVAIIISGAIFAQNNCIANFGDTIVSTYEYIFHASSWGDQNTWIWDFGDGTPVSTLQNPSHTYSDTGVYDVCLTVYNIELNDTLCSDTFCENITIHPNCIADFYYNSVNIFEYHFHTNQSGSQNTWVWDFGDGNIATDANPVHTYANGGVYHVCLTVYDININNDTLCSDTYCKNINIDTAFNCVANFEYADSSYDDHYNYFFNAYNYQVDQNTWNWDFGDGNVSTNNSITQFHTYTDTGTYEVCLTVYYIIQSNDTLCSDTYCESITIHPNCMADFYYNSVNVFEHHFHASQSGGAQNTWVWDFGDGNVATGVNPVHTYSDTGVYQVCLTVYDTTFNDTLCSDIYCENIIIDTTFNCVADFYYHYMEDSIGGYHFYANNQQGDQNTWFWDFGDGNIATSADIVHTYTNNGVYHACLTVYDINIL
jgi:PKD repeat protein